MKYLKDGGFNVKIRENGKVFLLLYLFGFLFGIIYANTISKEFIMNIENVYHNDIIVLGMGKNGSLMYVKEENRFYTKDKNFLTEKGYTPCKSCKP